MTVKRPPKLLPSLMMLKMMTLEKIIMLADELRLQAGTPKPRFGYLPANNEVFAGFCVEHESRCNRTTFREALIEYCVVLVEIIEQRRGEKKG